MFGCGDLKTGFYLSFLVFYLSFLVFYLSLQLLKLVQQLPFPSNEPFLWVFAVLSSTLLHVYRTLLASDWQGVFHVGTSWKSPHIPFWQWEKADGQVAAPWMRALWSGNAESPRSAAVPAEHTLQEPDIKTRYRTQMSSHNSLSVLLDLPLKCVANFYIHLSNSLSFSSSNNLSQCDSFQKKKKKKERKAQI